MTERLVSTVLAAVLLASCTAYRPLRPESLPGSLREGDRVWITMKDGTAATFTVVALSPDAIRGDSGRIVPLEAIEVIEVAPPQITETMRTSVALLAVGVGVVLVVAVLLVAMVVGQEGGSFSRGVP